MLVIAAGSAKEAERGRKKTVRRKEGWRRAFMFNLAWRILQ